MFSVPTYPPRADGSPDTGKVVWVTINPAYLVMFSPVTVPAAIANLTKEATLVHLALPGLVLIAAMDCEAFELAAGVSAIDSVAPVH